MAVISINLLGFEAKGAQSQDLGSRIKNMDRVWVVVGAMVIASILTSVIGTKVLAAKLNDAQARKTDLETQSKQLDDKLKDLVKLEAEKDNLVKEKTVLTRVTSTTFYWSRLLDEVRNKMPSNLWVLEMNTSGGSDASTSNELDIHCQSLSYQSIAVFMLNLQDSPYFQSVTLTSITEQAIASPDDKNGKEQILRDFTLKCMLNTGFQPVAVATPKSRDEADVERSKRFFQAIQK